MNEEVKNKLNQLAIDAIEKGYNVADYAMEQAPILIKQVLAYYGFYHSFYLFVGILFIALFVMSSKFTKKTWKEYKDNHNGRSVFDNEEIHLIVPHIVFIFGSFFIGISMIDMNIFPLAKILLAPQLYIFEYIKNMI